MKVKRFNENLEEYKLQLKKDLMEILDGELYTEDYYEGDKVISRDGKNSAIEEIIEYLEKEGILTDLALDSKKYNV